MRRSETMGAENCLCAVKITYEHPGLPGDEWEIVEVDVVRHCTIHYELEDLQDDPWDI